MGEVHSVQGAPGLKAFDPIPQNGLKFCQGIYMNVSFDPASPGQKVMQVGWGVGR
jgi:hypothetical protein